MSSEDWQSVRRIFFVGTTAVAFLLGISKAELLLILLPGAAVVGGILLVVYLASDNESPDSSPTPEPEISATKEEGPVEVAWTIDKSGAARVSPEASPTLRDFPVSSENSPSGFTEAPPILPPVSPSSLSPSTIQELEKLYHMLQKGLITEKEFQALKARIHPRT